MRKRITTFTLPLVLGVLLPWNAQAIPFGFSDTAGEYSYVGFALLESTFGSGVMIAPDVVLTAAHVVESFEPGSSVFGTSFDDPALEHVVSIASGIVHPLWDPSALLFDFGLLFLDEPIALSAYATLWPSDPASLAGMFVEAVGYGGTGTRRVGAGSIDELFGPWLVTGPLVEPGDSGGGLFVNVDGQNVLAGTTSFINGSSSFFGPVSQARSFIDQYVPDARWYGESVIVKPPVSVPEPATLALFAIGFFGAAARRCFRRSHRQPQMPLPALGA